MTAPSAPADAPSGASLDNNAKSSRQRVNRWEARGFLWTYSDLARCRKCGRVVVTGDGTVGVRANGRSVGYAGLATCGSVWACPVCNTKVQAVRRLEVGVALATLGAMHGGAAFGTQTVRHHARQPLSVSIDVLRAASNAVARSRPVATLRAQLGYLGRIRAFEVTHGLNGFHPHDHTIATFDRRPSQDALVDLHLAEFRAFRSAVERRGHRAPSILANVLLPVALDGSEPLADYFAKSEYTVSAVTWETTSTSTKKGRRGSRTPWQLLDSARAGDADDLGLWNEYERATRGKRALTFSRGLRDRLGVGSAAADEDIAAAEVGDAEDTGFRVTDWGPIVRRPALGAGLLNAVTPAGDWAAGRAYARIHGIELEDRA